MATHGALHVIAAMPADSKARQFYWRCPACGGWETYPPKRTEEFDISPETAPPLFSGRNQAMEPAAATAAGGHLGRRALFADHQQLRQ